MNLRPLTETESCRLPKSKSFSLAAMALSLFGPFFVLPLLTVSVIGATNDLAVLTSNSTSFAFTVSVPGDLSNLQRLTGADSSITFTKTVLVGIPTGGSARVVRSEGYDAVPVTDLTDHLAPTAQLVQLAAPTTVRGRQYVAVSINPIVGSQVYRRVVVELAFAGGLSSGAATDDPVFDRIFSRSIANYDQFARWPSMPL